MSSVNRVVAFIDTGGAAPDPWGHSKEEKRDAALTLLESFLGIDIFNEWSLSLLMNPHYQAAVTLLILNKVGTDTNEKKYASNFSHTFLDIQLSKRVIANSYFGKEDK